VSDDGQIVDRSIESSLETQIALNRSMSTSCFSTQWDELRDRFRAAVVS
jgi:hypothetical protein